MISQELQGYVQKKLDEGASREEISQALLGAGWDREDVDEVFSLIETGEDVVPMQVPKKTSGSENTESVAFDGAGTSLGKAFAEYGGRFATLSGIMLVAYVLQIIVAVGLIVKPLIQVSTAVLMATTGMSVIIFAVSFWSQIAVMYSVHHKTSVGDSFGKAASLLFSYFWIALLVGLSVFLGIIFFIIPGIILSVWFSFALYVLIVEGKKGTNALRASREYVRGHFWIILWKLIAGTFVIAGLALLLSVGLGLVVWLVMVAMGMSVFLYGDTAMQAVQGLVHVITAPIGAAYLYHVYMNLRDVKESGGVVAYSKGKYVAFVLLGVFGLVIIPILILVSIVLASLNDAREIGSDAAIKANINNARATAALYYDNYNNTYEGVCNESEGISSAVESAESSGSKQVVCNDAPSSWAVSAQIVSDPTQYYCADSLGFAGEVDESLGIGDTQCPDEDTSFR